MLSGVALNLGLIGLALIRYSTIFGAERAPFIVIDVALLVAYAAVALGAAFGWVGGAVEGRLWSRQTADGV